MVGPIASYENVNNVGGIEALGLHALPGTEPLEHVEEEVVEVRARGEIVLVEDQGLLAVVFWLDAVLVLFQLEVEEIR